MTDHCYYYNVLILYVTVIVLLSHSQRDRVSCLRVSGKITDQDVFTLIAKFAGQRVITFPGPDAIKHSMYVFGNASSPMSNKRGSIEQNVVDRLSLTGCSSPFTLVVVNKELFLNLYKNNSEPNKNKACSLMMDKIGKLSYLSAPINGCQSGTEDYLRSLPCRENSSCFDQPEDVAVVPNYQFTFEKDSSEEKFWFVSIVACSQCSNESCSWRHSVPKDSKLSYDIWMVNGNPYSSHHNLFKYHFSFDNQNRLEIYMVFFALYAILVPMQIYAVTRQKHHLTKVFTIALCLEPTGIFLNIIHYVLFAFDGVGIEPFAITGDFVNILSESIFMLLLLLLAKGWPITRTDISWKPVLCCIWLLYTCIHFILHVWKLTEIDIVEDIDEYQTLPGCLIIGFRIVIMGWFFAELRYTMISESDAFKLQFYLHFGAGILMYFVYLPVVALIALHVSTMIRQKLLLGMTCSADFLAFAIMANLLWPTRSEQYFQLASIPDASDELEEFNEAPHNVNSRANSQASC